MSAGWSLNGFCDVIGSLLYLPPRLRRFVSRHLYSVGESLGRHKTPVKISKPAGDDEVTNR
jgi:hypothetical protein